MRYTVEAFYMCLFGHKLTEGQEISTHNITLQVTLIPKLTI